MQAACRSLHRFLVDQSEAGTIFRQEAVSMIPALFLEKEMRVSTALYHERSWRGLTGFEWRKVPSDCRLAVRLRYADGTTLEKIDSESFLVASSG